MRGTHKTTTWHRPMYVITGNGYGWVYVEEPGSDSEDEQRLPRVIAVVKVRDMFSRRKVARAVARAFRKAYRCELEGDVTRA